MGRTSRDNFFLSPDFHALWQSITAVFDGFVARASRRKPLLALFMFRAQIRNSQNNKKFKTVAFISVGT